MADMKKSNTPPLSHAGQAQWYAESVVNGSVPAGGWVRKAAQRHLDDLKRSKTKAFRYVFKPEKGAIVCEFIEMLPHTKGRWAAKKEMIKLQPWQCFLVVVGFGWQRKDSGKRRFRTFYWEIPRKNGKSLLAGGIANYMFCADGEFGAEIYSGATTEKQALEVFTPARLMMQRSPELAAYMGIEVMAKSMIIAANGSKFEPVIGNPGDGSSPSCAVVDEFHEHDTPVLYDTMETGMGAREQPLILAITTAGANIAGPCHEKHMEVQKVLDGVQENDELFGVMFGIDSAMQEYNFQSSTAIRRLDKLCNCGCVPNTRIVKLWRAAYVDCVISANGGRDKRSDAKTTLTGQSETGIYAGVATSNSSLTETQNEKLAQLSEGKNGQRQTSIKSRQQKINPKRSGDLILTTDELEKTKSSQLFTELISLSTKEDTLHNEECAEYAKDTKRLYALITATQQGAFADFCAGNATLQLAYSETLRKAFEEHLPTCKAVERSRIKDGVLVVTEPPDDWASPASLIKANPNYGISVDADFLLAQQRQALQNPMQQNKFKTKHLNVWTSVMAGVMNMQQWALCEDQLLDEDELIGSDCWTATDLASKSDLCANQRLYRKIISGKPHYYLFGTYWLPEGAIEEPGPNQAHYRKWVNKGVLIQTDGATVDFEQITDTLIADCKRINPIEAIFDPFNAVQMMQAMMAQGIDAVEFIQTPANFAVPMDELLTAVKDGRFHHDGNEMTTWCMSNMVARVARKGLMAPVKQKPHQKIDGAIASIMAMARACASDGKTTMPDDYELLTV